MTDRIREILAGLKPAAVYLFGSAAKGHARPESDLDLAILPTSVVINRPLSDFDRFLRECSAAL